jgi:hypothetical protein
MAAGPDADDLRGELGEEAAHGAAPFALPEPEVEVDALMAVKAPVADGLGGLGSWS